MENRTRYKGQFIKKKVLDKKMKVISSIRQRKNLNASKINNHVKPNLCEGRRIVELKELGKNLKCCNCGVVLSLENVIDELHLGLKSILTVECCKCLKSTKVPTGKTHVTHYNLKHSDANTSAVLGTIHAGFGYTGLNKILACLNIPIISEHLYKRYEREVGKSMEEAAQESCKKAAEEEKILVHENIEQLCELL